MYYCFKDINVINFLNNQNKVLNKYKLSSY